MHKYNYYKTDGTKEVIESEKILSLDKLHELVEGYIEGLRLANGNYIFLNEEGNLIPLPKNPHFTNKDILTAEIDAFGGIKGNVIEGKVDHNGDFVGVNIKI